MRATLAMFGLLMAWGSAAAEDAPKRELAEILKDIGCKITSTEKVKDNNLFWAEYKRGGRTIVFYSCLSPSKSRIWVNLPLVALDEESAARHPEKLVRLLRLNQEFGPNHFQMSKTDLYLSGSVENRGVENHHIRDLLERLIDNMEDSRRDWEFEWTKPTTSTTKK